MALWLALIARAFTGGGVFAWSVGIIYVSYDTALQIFVLWQTRHMSRAVPVAVGEPPTLAVIIAAHNEAAALPGTVETLLAQKNPPQEIWVADDGSTDATASVLAAAYGMEQPGLSAVSVSATHPTLRWLRLPHQGKARALNAVLPRVGTEIVLTVDADTLLEPGALDAMRAAFGADPGLVAATGVLAPVCGASLRGRIFQWFQTYEYVRNFLSRYAWMQLNGLLLISGAFAGFRRSAVLAVGGFDDDCLVEDYELIHRLRRYAGAHGLDWRSAVLGGAQARTDAPAGLGAFLRQRRRWFGGFLQTQFWYRDMVGNRKYGWLGTAMLPVKALDTLQPLYGLTAFALLVFYLATGRVAVLLPVAGIMGAKILFDLGFHLWGVRLYRGWAGPTHKLSFVQAFASALAEPFSFQLLRHAGAAWGWVAFLGGSGSWGARSRREGVLPAADRSAG